jgi:hypothetical protein
MRGKRGAAGKVAADIFVIILCVSGAAGGGWLFWTDLNKTLTKQSETPVAILTYKHNVAQRRFEDRLVWSQLQRESPLYSGDLIRTEAVSDASIAFANGLVLDLAENCLVQVFVNKNGDTRIDLSDGNISVNAQAEGELVIFSDDNKVSVAAGSAVSVGTAAAGGLNVQVAQGSAVVATPVGVRQAEAGFAVAVQGDGSIATGASVSIVEPTANWKILATGNAPSLVFFSWKTANFSANDRVCLDIAVDRNFTRIVQTFDQANGTSATAELSPGAYFWRAYVVSDGGAGAGGDTATSAAAAFVNKLTILAPPLLELIAPAEGAIYTFEADLPSVRLQWTDNEEAIGFLLEVANAEDMISPQIRTQVQTASYLCRDLDAAAWFWRVTPVYPSGYRGTPQPSRKGRFVVENAAALPPATPLPADEATPDEPSAPDEAVPPAEPEPAPEVPPGPEAVPEPRVPIPVTLTFPANGYTFAGPDALRRSGAVRWSSSETPARSRFVLSRNANPLTGAIVMDITNPARVIQLPSLPEGIYYWTIRATSGDGLDISARRPFMFRVGPPPVFPAPQGLRPANGSRFDSAYMQSNRSITFSWQVVTGANAYIFTLLPAGGAAGNMATGRPIVQTGPLSTTSYTIADLSILDIGTFTWQVEAVRTTQQGAFEVRGAKTESRFTIDIPQPAKPVLGDTGTMYGRE